jgi:RNA polymerase sigma-70 factor, ECF subfamily
VVLLAALHFPNRSDAPPEAALPQRLVQKDVRAFERLYDLHARTVYSLVFRIVQQSSTAEELVQDIFLHLWRNAEQYDSAKGPFVPWLLTLARNRTLDHLRLKSERQRRREELPETLPQVAVVPGYEEALDEKRRAERVRQLMLSLYPQQKRAIELAYFEGLSHSEIAVALKEPLGTVKSWIRNGLQRLKEGLQATS